ncbi:MAG TPA: PDZ domain-containing protein [Thermoanaerobaculia bacterium]
MTARNISAPLLAAVLAAGALSPASAAPPAATAATTTSATTATTATSAPAAATPPSLPITAREDELRESMRQLVRHARDQVFPALVHIETVTVQYEGGEQMKGRAAGSGTIISKQGHVLTNQHVTQNAKQFRCTLSDRREATAELVGEDPLTDLAVLKLNLKDLHGGADLPAGLPADLPVARFGDSSKLEVGDYVMAMGSPFSLSRSVTLGIVSNTERVFAQGFLGRSWDDLELEPGQRTGLFTVWIQHDALINPGNSGGPLVDLAGEVVGINELGGASIGFAIPSRLASAVAAELIAHGEVTRSSIGVSFRPLLDTDLRRGLLVDSVTAGGPAARAGLKTGDVVLALDGAPVTARFYEELPPIMSRIAGLAVGTRLRLTVARDGRELPIEVATEKLERDRGDERAFRGWGFTAEDITAKLRRDLSLGAPAGVLVTGVRSGSPAQLAQPPLADGDVVTAIGGAPVKSLADLAARYPQLSSAADGVLVELDRRGKSYVTLLGRRGGDDEPPPRELSKAWIGIATQPVADTLAARLSPDDVRGFRITRVYPHTAAAGTGLAVGDLIVALNGDPLAPRGMEDSGLFDSRVRRLEVDGTATLTVVRAGKPRQETVHLEETRTTPSEALREKTNALGLTVREVTFFDRDENRWPDEIGGVLADRVESAGQAEAGGIHPSDLVERIDRYPVRGVESYKKALAALALARPKRVAVVVRRGQRSHLQYLEPDWDAGELTRREP